MWWAPVTYPCFMVWVLSRDRNGRTNGFFDCGMDVMATTGSGRVSCSMWAPRVGDVLKNVQWRLVRKNAPLGVNERRWMLLCRIIHLLGALVLWVLSLVSGALLDYSRVIPGKKNLWCRVQGLQAPRPSKKSPDQVQKQLPSTGRRLGGMWCCADHQGVVRVWQRSTQSGSPWVGDLLPMVDSVAKIGSSKIVQGLRLALDGPGACRRWRIEVGTLVPGRYLSLGNSSCWETKGYLMKARPCVWLNPKGGIIARAGCHGLSMFPASFVVDRCTECRVGDMGCWVVASQRQQQQQQQQQRLQQHPQYCQNEPSRCDIGQERKVQGLCVGWKFKKRLRAQCTYSEDWCCFGFFLFTRSWLRSWWYCGSGGDNDLMMICICVFCLRQFVVLLGPVSAAITVGRSVFVWSAVVNLSRYLMPGQQR